ncbi:unnamed protein product [Phytophthora fragariaefolia]|uniref:Unnamed protein product n=1 Tax=Phytophthora fragariaefolia TaxID=1490495 RepID=A0A9W6YG96_9STRA|nr:unnamed protein product [Phytophthora fragariaefolia]
MTTTTHTSLADKAPAFEVPTFDYETLSTENTPNDVLAALKKDGIISFTNVPSFAQVRRAYLDSAAACAVSAQEVNAEFLLHKTLSDGTNRYTINTPSGQEANPNATTTDAACPDTRPSTTSSRRCWSWWCSTWLQHLTPQTSPRRTATDRLSPVASS